MTKLIQIFKDIKSFLDTHTSSFMLEALYTPRIFINPGGIPKKDPQQGKGIPDSSGQEWWGKGLIKTDTGLKVMDGAWVTSDVAKILNNPKVTKILGPSGKKLSDTEKTILNEVLEEAFATPDSGIEIDTKIFNKIKDLYQAFYTTQKDIPEGAKPQSETTHVQSIKVITDFLTSLISKADTKDVLAKIKAKVYSELETNINVDPKNASKIIQAFNPAKIRAVFNIALTELEAKGLRRLYARKYIKGEKIDSEIEKFWLDVISQNKLDAINLELAKLFKFTTNMPEVDIMTLVKSITDKDIQSIFKFHDVSIDSKDILKLKNLYVSKLRSQSKDIDQDTQSKASLAEEIKKLWSQIDFANKKAVTERIRILEALDETSLSSLVKEDIKTILLTHPGNKQTVKKINTLVDTSVEEKVEEKEELPKDRSYFVDKDIAVLNSLLHKFLPRGTETEKPEPLSLEDITDKYNNKIRPALSEYLEGNSILLSNLDKEFDKLKDTGRLQGLVKFVKDNIDSSHFTRTKAYISPQEAELISNILLTRKNDDFKVLKSEIQKTINNPNILKNLQEKFDAHKSIADVEKFVLDFKTPKQKFTESDIKQILEVMDSKKSEGYMAVEKELLRHYPKKLVSELTTEYKRNGDMLDVVKYLNSYFEAKKETPEKSKIPSELITIQEKLLPKLEALSDKQPGSIYITVKNLLRLVKKDQLKGLLFTSEKNQKLIKHLIEVYNKGANELDSLDKVMAFLKKQKKNDFSQQTINDMSQIFDGMMQILNTLPNSEKISKIKKVLEFIKAKDFEKIQEEFQKKPKTQEYIYKLIKLYSQDISKFKEFLGVETVNKKHEGPETILTPIDIVLEQLSSVKPDLLKTHYTQPEYDKSLVKYTESFLTDLKNYILSKKKTPNYTGIALRILKEKLLPQWSKVPSISKQLTQLRDHLVDLDEELEIPEDSLISFKKELLDKRKQELGKEYSDETQEDPEKEIETKLKSYDKFLDDHINELYLQSKTNLDPDLKKLLDLRFKDWDLSPEAKDKLVKTLEKEFGSKVKDITKSSVIPRISSYLRYLAHNSNSQTIFEELKSISESLR